jgi:hypothetical protein
MKQALFISSIVRGGGNLCGLDIASAPEFFERSGVQLGMAHRVLNALVPEPRLNPPRIVPRIRQRAAASAAHCRGLGEKPLGADFMTRTSNAGA